MMVIDTQLHEPAVSFAWKEADQQTRWDLLLEIQLAYMQSVGIDRALLFPAEAAWGGYARSRLPDRFALVPMVGNPAYGGIDPASPSIGKLIAEQRRTPGVVAIRIVRGRHADWLEQAMPAIRACACEGLPIFLTATGDLTAAARIAQAHPEMTIIIDHLGLPQAPGEQPESPPFRSLPKVLALAAHPNIAVKLSSAVSLSAQRYPFVDLWPHLRQMVEAFGPQRLMWGSDISRFIGRVGFEIRIPGAEGDYVPNHSYAEALFYLRETDELSRDEKAWILGGAAQRLLGWPS